LRSLKHKFRCQKSRAKIRGVVFRLSFEQWLQIWRKSGKLAKRGRGGLLYVMARKGDRGAYAVGNVEIITHKQNCRDRRASEETRHKISQGGRGLIRSAETRERIRQAMTGRVFSLATRRRMSLGQLARQVREREARNG